MPGHTTLEPLGRKSQVCHDGFIGFDNMRVVLCLQCSRRQEACEMFTNTEMLSYIYRALGTKVGKRVQIDQPLSFYRFQWRCTSGTA